MCQTTVPSVLNYASMAAGLTNGKVQVGVCLILVEPLMLTFSNIHARITLSTVSLFLTM